MGSIEPLSGLAEQLSISSSQGFDYEALDSETRITVQQCTSEIKSLMRQTAQDIIGIGQQLTEVKQQLGHGHFRNWLKAEFNWSASAATKFMQVSQQFKWVKFTHLDIAASALYILAAPSTPAKARQEALERAIQGEAISHTKAKAIVTQHKESAKSKASKPVTVDVSALTVVRDSSTPAELSPASQPVEVQSAAVFEQSESKLPGKKTEALAHLQVRNRSHDMDTATDSSDRPPKDQALTEIQSLFGVGNLISAVLSQHPDVRQSCVMERSDVTGNKRLVAYVVSNLIPNRVPMQSTCLAEFDGERTMELETEDISSSGVFLIGVPDDWQQGQRVRLRLRLPIASSELVLSGSVAWRQSQRAGIEFEPTPAEQALLQQSVEYLLETQGFKKFWQRTTAEQLGSFLKQKLPDYMLPDSLVMLNALLLTDNGEVDRRALPALGNICPELEEAVVVPCKSPSELDSTV